MSAPRCWDVIGGHVERGEDPAHAALREAREEVGFDGEVRLVPSLVYLRSPSFKYENFLGIIDREFVPTLNGEHSRAGWYYPDRLPRPLHRGTELLFERCGRQIMDAAIGAL